MNSHPLCHFSSFPRQHDAQFFNQLRERVIHEVMQNLDLLPQFTIQQLTPKKLEQLTHILDQAFFENQLLQFAWSQNIKVKYCVSHKPEADFSAIIYYEGKTLRICVNTARYENVIGRNNNGIRIRHRLENLIVDICHEMIHLLLYSCTGQIQNDKEAHRGLFALGNRYFFNHTQAFYEEE